MMTDEERNLLMAYHKGVGDGMVKVADEIIELISRGVSYDSIDDYAVKVIEDNTCIQTQ